MRSTFLASIILGIGLAGMTGCTNPNSIGVQTYGSITVHCVRSSDNSPVPGAYITVAGITQTADGSGSSTFQNNIPVGPELFVAQATGLRGSLPVTVKEGVNPDVTVQMQPAN